MTRRFSSFLFALSSIFMVSKVYSGPMVLAACQINSACPSLYVPSITFTGDGSAQSSAGASSGSVLPLTGGTLTGALNLTGSGSSVTTASSITASAFFGTGLDIIPSSNNGSEFKLNSASTTLDVSNSLNGIGSFVQRPFSGNLSSKTQIPNGTTEGTFGFAPYDGTNGYQQAAGSYGCTNLEVFSSTGHGTSCFLKVTPVGATSLSTVVTYTSGTTTMGVNQSIIQSGAKGFITSASSITASAFFGSGAALTGVTVGSNIPGSVTFGSLVSQVQNTIYGVEISSTDAPGVSCDAGSPTMSSHSSSTSGSFTVGSSATTCTVTFPVSWPNTPSCICNDQAGTITRTKATSTTNSVTCTLISGTYAGGSLMNYICIGAQ